MENNKAEIKILSTAAQKSTPGVYIIRYTRISGYPDLNMIFRHKSTNSLWRVCEIAFGFIDRETGVECMNFKLVEGMQELRTGDILEELITDSSD